MLVNKAYFLKENTLFRNGIKIERRTAKEYSTVSTADIRELTAKKMCCEGKLWYYQGDEQITNKRADFLAVDFLGKCSSASRNATHK